MKQLTYILLLLAAPLAANAQALWTMDRCIRYALEHATEVKRQQIEMRQKKIDCRTALLDLLPSVEAQVSGQYSWGRNIDPETNTYNNVTTFNNYYQLQASLPLFDGGQAINALRQARLARRNSLTALEKAQDDKALAVMERFIDAVYARQSITLCEEKLRDSQALLAKTRRLFDLGEKSRPDVAQLESQVADDDYNLLHQQNTARQALMELKSQMNYPIGDTLALDPRITQPDAAGTALTTSGDKPAVVLAENAAEQARLEWLIQRAALLPRLTFGAGVSTNYYKNLSQSGGYASFGSQLHNNLGEYAYLTLSIPLFRPSGWRRMKRAQADYQLAQIGIEEARRKQHDEAAKAVMDCEGYRREVSQMHRKMAADSLAYHLSCRKYEEGMLSTFDLHAASQALIQSRIRLLQMQMMLTMKQKLVNYYIKNQPLWTLK